MPAGTDCFSVTLLAFCVGLDHSKGNARSAPAGQRPDRSSSSAERYKANLLRGAIENDAAEIFGRIGFSTFSTHPALGRTKGKRSISASEFSK